MPDDEAKASISEMIFSHSMPQVFWQMQTLSIAKCKVDSGAKKEEPYAMETSTFSQRLAQIVRARGLKKKEVAVMCGIEYHALNAILIRENAVPNAQIAYQISVGLDVPLTWLLYGRMDDRPLVAVAGRVGAGAKVPLVDGYAKGDGLFHVARPAMLPANGVAAVEVEGDSMAPMYQPGHVLFFARHIEDGVIEDEIGKPCIVEDANGNAWVKLLKRGGEPGLWNLLSLNPSAESMWDTKIRWASKVMLALPAELVERASGY